MEEREDEDVNYAANYVRTRGTCAWEGIICARPTTHNQGIEERQQQHALEEKIAEQRRFLPPPHGARKTLALEERVRGENGGKNDLSAFTASPSAEKKGWKEDKSFPSFSVKLTIVTTLIAFGGETTKEGGPKTLYSLPGKRATTNWEGDIHLCHSLPPPFSMSSPPHVTFTLSWRDSANEAHGKPTLRNPYVPKLCTSESFFLT